MTKERACANDTARQVEPITSWDNEACDGLALCRDDIFHERIDTAQELRDRQAAYLESLPTDTQTATSAALKLIHPGGNDYPDGIEEALHLCFALEALVKQGDLDAQGRSRDAAFYIVDRVGHAMHRATRQLDHISNILGNPGRVERGR